MKRSLKESDDSYHLLKPTKKLLSAVGAVNRLGEISDTQAFDHITPNTLAEIHNQPDTLKRNKRIFGALMGHLGMAKKLLEEDSSKIGQQSTLQVAASKKNSLESQRLLTIQREREHAERQKESLIQERSHLKFRQNEIPLLTASWKVHMKSLEVFLMTKCSQRLPWLPARFSESTKTLLVERKFEIKKTVADREEKDRKELKSLQDKLDCVLEKLNSINNELEKFSKRDAVIQILSPTEPLIALKKNNFIHENHNFFNIEDKESEDLEEGETSDVLSDQKNEHTYEEKVTNDDDDDNADVGGGLGGEDLLAALEDHGQLRAVIKEH